MREFAISICDDEQVIHEIVKEILIPYYDRQGTKVVFKSYYDGEELLKDAAKQRVILMDIDMPKVDGIAASYMLHEINPDAIIILLTAMKERFKDGFKVGATRFVSKPIDAGELIEAVENARCRDFDAPELCVTEKGHLINIDQKKIFMIESDRNSIVIHLSKRDIVVYKTLNEIEKELSERAFLRVHKRYIVNMRHISRVQNREIILEDGMKAEISIRREKEVVRRLREYDLNMRG
ncbi:MAG: response regulator transcription factor [Lachnospiraceae bacterium]|nr:response regulator transcription factor [Lachnospiraceae bacterium]